MPSARNDMLVAVRQSSVVPYFFIIDSCSLSFFHLSIKGCSQLACIACCSDLQCEGHKEARDVALWKNQVLQGTTDVQKKLKAKRESAILPGSFRESGFRFMNETIMIWNRQQFMDNSKWREDAIRRADKRKARSLNTRKPIRNSVKRFRDVMEDLYQKSLEEGKNKEDSVAKRTGMQSRHGGGSRERTEDKCGDDGYPRSEDR